MKTQRSGASGGGLFYPFSGPRDRQGTGLVSLSPLAPIDGVLFPSRRKEKGSDRRHGLKTLI
jgi:hypothetical protein